MWVMSAPDLKCALGPHYFVLCNVQNCAMWNTLMLSSCSCIAVAGQVVVLTIEINLFPSACWITHTMPPCHMIIHTIPYIPHGLAHHTTCVPAGSAARPPYKSRPCLATHCLANDAQFFFSSRKNRAKLIRSFDCLNLSFASLVDFLGVFKTSKNQVID